VQTPTIHDSQGVSDPVRRFAGRSVAAIAVGSLLFGAIAPTVFAAEQVPGSTPAPVAQAAGDNETVINVAEQASPAVVTIEVSSGDPVAPDASADPGTTDPFGQMDPFKLLPEGGFIQGSGSGVIVDPDGLILTNRHVVDGADTVTVLLSDGRTLDGKVVGIDTYTDFALVRVDASDLPTVELGDSNALRVGQLAVAIGSPLGKYPGTVSAGIVSGLDRSIDVSDMTSGASRLRHLIQTDAAINPGNSGGALLDGDGKLIGINTAMAGSAQGIGFALPIAIAKPIVEQVRAGKEIARPWMGVSFMDIDAQLAKDEKLPVQAGAWIHAGDNAGSAVVDGSPAADAGIKAEDIITALEGQTVDADHPLDLLLLTFEPGQAVTVTVLRDGAEQDLQMTLGTRPADLGQ
jgi:serine protease Do